MSVEGWLLGWLGQGRARTGAPSVRTQGLKVSVRARQPRTPHPCVPCPVSAPAQPARTWPQSGGGSGVGGGPGPRLPRLPASPLPANRFRCVSWFSLCLTLTELRSSQQLLAALNSVSQDSGHAITPHDNMTQAGVKAGRAHLEPDDEGRRP